MPIDRSQTIVSRTGAIVLDSDDIGWRDSNSRYNHYAPPIVVPILASSIDGFVWTCHEGIWRIWSISEAHTVVGGASCALQVVVCPQSVAIASGVAQLSAALDLTVTAPAVRFGAMIPAPTVMTRGDSVGFDFSGTMTGLVGVATVQLARVG